MSLFDDFNRDLAGNPVISYQEETPEPILLDTGFVNVMPEEDEGAIFVLDRVQYKPSSMYNRMVVSNNIICLMLENNSIVRLDLGNAKEVETIDIGRRPEDRMHNMFLDPTGKHLLISLQNGDILYLHHKWKKPRMLTKAKGFLVESVGWNRASNEATTKEILLGSDRGAIYEVEIEPTEEAILNLKKQVDKTFKLVHRLREGSPVTGLRIETFPSNNRKFFILATTPSCIFTFIGTPNPAGGPMLYESIFQSAASSGPFLEMPAELKSSMIGFFVPNPGKPANSFAWLTSPGVYYGSFVFGSQAAGENVIDAARLLPYPTLTASRTGVVAGRTPISGAQAPATAAVPLSIAVTEFHFLLLYPDRVLAMCRLNEEVVLETYFPPRSGEVVRFAVDEANNTMWVLTTTNIFEVISNRESRNIWEVYLKEQQYDLALDYANNAVQRDKVLTAQADQFFAQDKFPQAAALYARTQKSFEEVTLKFVRKEQRDALKTFLMNKRDALRPGDATQFTLIATWLVEIYLDKLVTLRERGERAAADGVSKELRMFLASSNVKDQLNHATTYNLMSSYGCTEEMVAFAEIVEDHERVISFYIQQGTKEGDRKALDTMSKQSSADTFYKFSPVLIERLPVETVDIWIRQGSVLDAKHLIPALMKYTPARGERNQAIRYLEIRVKDGYTDPAIHNYLLSLYAQQPDDSSLLAFLKNAEAGRTAHFDLQYALRLCMQHGKTQACIYIYAAMGLYEEAVELALKVKDIALAQINADQAEEDESLRRKLWLRIARHVVEEERDIKKAMDFLRETDLLKIEDILPFFPDFVLIDHFKEQICDALSDYNRHIDELKQEMDDATRSAEAIRSDIRELRNKSGVVAANGTCKLCAMPLLTRAFYMFPCDHVFHTDCLTAEVLKGMTNTQRQRVADLQNKVATEASSAAARKKAQMSSVENAPANVTSAPRADQARVALDDAIASDCPLCGDAMVKSVERPFIVDSELDAIVSWRI